MSGERPFPQPEQREREERYVYSVLELQGNRTAQEDAYVIERRDIDGQPAMLVAVADGHGVDGAKMSQKAAGGVVREVGNALISEVRLQEIFNTLHQELSAPQVDGGSTLTFVCIRQGEILTAHVGDSEARIVKTNGETTLLTPSHRLGDSASETERLRKLGATYKNGYLRVGDDGLNMSRSLGDPTLSAFVSAIPEVRTAILSDKDRFLLVASDGFWDFWSEPDGQYQIEAVLRQATTADALKGKLLKLMSAWQLDDNLTLVIVDLQPFQH